jgi:hypothetical protein
MTFCGKTLRYSAEYRTSGREDAAAVDNRY